MNCIDAIEGSAKSIIDRLHQVFLDDKLDDADFIRNVKAVLKGTESFVESSTELLHDPKVMSKVLYDYSKDLWMSALNDRLKREAEEEGREWDEKENKEYYEYYYDYIYVHSIYPK